MRSHYRRSGARWFLVAAALAYAPAATLAPALHFAEELPGAEGHPVPHALVHAGVEGPDPSSDGPHVPGDLDCLFCQLLVSPAHPGPPDLGPGDHPGASAEAQAAPTRIPGSDLPSVQARAPPLT